MNAPVSLCVYCASRSGTDGSHVEVARAVGRGIARNGWQLVYGGGRAGLMGAVADAALEGGARVVGVIPRTLVDRELAHTGLHELHVVETMHQRKQMMAERSDAFLALPGGIGTLEELFEAWTWHQLGYHDKPVALLNAGGYYDDLLRFLDQASAGGFVPPAQRALLHVGIDVDELLDRLATLATKAIEPDDYRRI